MNAITLSSQQQATIDWVRRRKGSAVLQARAGTGKTFTIVNGVVHTIYNEQPRASVAVMAYNKAAGDEINSRLQTAGLTDWKRVKAGTCHSFGFQAFRKMAPQVRVDDKKVADIISTIHGGDETHFYYVAASSIRKAVSMAKQMAFGFLKNVDDQGAWFDLVEKFDLADELPDGFEAINLITAATTVLKQSIAKDFEVIDFDDMVLAPLVHKARFWQYDYVIMDEAQDTNPARRALAFAMLKPKWGRFLAVGDDRQAIYGFTGADSDSLEIIRRETNAEVLPLTETRRCPKAVVAMAKILVPDFVALPEAPEGVVRRVDYEDRGHGNKIWFVGESLGKGDAILCRNTKPLISEAYTLIRNGIGCMVEGRDIGNGLITLATRWKRIKTVGALSDKLDEYRDREVAKFQAKGKEEKAAAVEDKVECLKTVIDKVRADGQHGVEDVVAAIRKLFGETDEATDVVTLCTLHRSKGREWNRVFHLGREIYLPSRYAKKPEQLRQEENLEYVGFTRAKSEYIDIVVEV